MHQSGCGTRKVGVPPKVSSALCAPYLLAPPVLKLVYAPGYSSYSCILGFHYSFDQNFGRCAIFGEFSLYLLSIPSCWAIPQQQLSYCYYRKLAIIRFVHYFESEVGRGIYSNTQLVSAIYPPSLIPRPRPKIQVGPGDEARGMGPGNEANIPQYNTQGQQCIYNDSLS